MTHRISDGASWMTATRARRLVLSALPAVLIVLFGVALLVGQRSAERAARETDAIVDEVRKLESFLDLVTALETRQRDHLITGDTTFLADYRFAREQLAMQLDSVRALVGRRHGNGSERPAQLERLVSARVAALDSGIVLLRTRGPAVAHAYVGRSGGPDIMRRIRAQISAHEQEDMDVARRKADEERRRAGWLFGITVFGTILAVGSSLGTGAGLEHALRQREDANARLNAQASDLEGQTIELEELLEAQRESEERFHALTDFAADLTFVVDARGRITYVSRAVGRVLGHSPEKLIGGYLTDIAHPGDVPVVEETLAGLVAKPRSTGEFEVRVANASDDWCIVAARASSLLDVPSVNGVVINAHDVTERRRVEAQFRQAQKMEAVGRLTAGIAHDFNNLLTAISGYARFAQDESSEEHVRADLDEVVASSARASALTRQLLAFSRQQVLRPRLLEPNHVIRQMVPLIRRTLSSDIELSTHLGEDTGPVLADPGQIEQVLLNLAVNARDAMPHGGRLAIETRRIDADAQPGSSPGSRGWVALTVTDTGQGMPADVRDRIFEPFFTTKSGKGTGLGLSTAYGIVQQSGGDINVYSEPGHGTVFKIRLPIADATSEEAAAVRWTGPEAEPSGEPVPGGDGRTALIIEDDDAVRGFVQRGLEELGYVVLAPPEAEDALAILKDDRQAIDVLVTDVIMPRMSASAVADEARTHRPDLPILFVSGYTYNQILERRVLPPDVNFLEKPFSIEALAREIHRLTR